MACEDFAVHPAGYVPRRHVQNGHSALAGMFAVGGER